MSLAALERTDSSTEAILLDVVDRLQGHAEMLARLSVTAVADEQDPAWQRFYLDDNPTASVLRIPGRLFIHYSNMTAHRYEDFREDPLELTVGFSELVGYVEPLPITDPASLMVGITPNHLRDLDAPDSGNQHQYYRPKFWPHDGGFSLETAPDAPSLDEGSIRRMAEFADQVAGMTNFNPVKIRH